MTLAVPGEIGRAFARAGGSEYISGDGATRLAVAEHGAVFGFADRDVRRGEIEKDVRAGECAFARWRRRRPEILADLDVKAEVGIFCMVENLVGAEIRAAVQKLDRVHVTIGRDAEITFLVELAVIGQEGFGNDPEHVAALDHDSAIVERAAHANWRAHYEDREKAFAFSFEPSQRSVDRIEQRILEQEVVDGVAGERKLWRQQHGRLGLVRFAPERQNTLGVCHGICRRDDRRAGGDAHEAVRVEVLETVSVSFAGHA
jgi:hypothetical protein